MKDETNHSPDTKEYSDTLILSVHRLSKKHGESPISICDRHGISVRELLHIQQMPTPIKSDLNHSPDTGKKVDHTTDSLTLMKEAVSLVESDAPHKEIKRVLNLIWIGIEATETELAFKSEKVDNCGEVGEMVERLIEYSYESRDNGQRSFLNKAADLLERTEAKRVELEADRNEILSLVRQANARFLRDEDTIGGLLLCQILCPIDGQGDLWPNRIHTESSLGCQEATKQAYAESIEGMERAPSMEFDADGEIIAAREGGSDGS